MLDLISANETVSGHQLRAWTGVATDEGVGILCVVEFSDTAGRPVCRFETFLDAAPQRPPAWPSADTEAAQQLQADALDRARTALAANALETLNGHRFDTR